MQKKVIILTGASKGIGKCIAHKMASSSHKMILVSRNPEHLRALCQEILTLYPGCEVTPVAADVRQSLDIKKVVALTLHQYKKIDVLINNAGILRIGNVWETSEEDWDEIMDINLKGTFLFSKEVIPQMIQQNDGYIINISSGAGKRASSEWGAYSASKFGVMGLTESMLQELRPYNIKVTALCPGPTNTPIFDGYNRKDLDTMLKPEYIAETIEFLLKLPQEVAVPEISVRPTCR